MNVLKNIYNFKSSKARDFKGTKIWVGGIHYKKNVQQNQSIC